MFRFIFAGVATVLLAASFNVSADQEATPADPPQLAPDLAQFDRIAGYYQMGPRAVIRLFREDARLYMSAAGTNQKREIFAETAERYKVDGLPVSITFKADPAGKVGQATINQAGRDIIAPRVTEQAANALVAASTLPPPPSARTWAVRLIPHRVVTTRSDNNVDYWPSFTPDGARILFSRSADGGRSWALLSTPVSGGAEQVVFERPGLAVTRASSSAQGGLAFNVGNAIWTLQSAGIEARALSLKEAIAPAYASWYPDGKDIAFVDGARNTLYRADVATGQMTALTPQSVILAGMPSVSPDGNLIAFAGQKNTGQPYSQNDNQLWLLDSSGTVRQLETNPGQARTPSWSPDGKRIAFESVRGSPDGSYAIFIVRLDGSGLTQVTEYALNANHPAWSPDGGRLVFSWGSQPARPNGIAMIDLPE
jgi:dipeptidyl aminopeptidase/acylaminoacyl peptidase